LTENKRFTYWEEDIGQMLIPQCKDNGKIVARSVYECVDLLNALHEENQQLKEEIDGLKVTLQARDILISICEKKFCELGYIITVDDDGYVIE
jgi:hypothetical protein